MIYCSSILKEEDEFLQPLNMILLQKQFNTIFQVLSPFKKLHSWQHWFNKIWHFLSVYMFYLSDEITISDKEVIFLLGGFESSTIQGSLRKLELPTDICHLFQNDPHQCKTTLGCAFCSHFDGLKPNKTYCYSNTRSKPAACSSEFQSGMYPHSFCHIDVK